MKTNNHIENINHNYKGMLYKSGPTKASDFVLDKYSTIHNKLYESAISKFLHTKPQNFRDTHKLIEIKNDEYALPSQVKIINKSYPYDNEIIDLTPYWDNYQFEYNNKDLQELQLPEDTVKFAELIYIDYTKGKCKFKSKISGETFWASFDYVNENTIVSPDIILDNTFTYLFNSGKNNID